MSIDMVGIWNGTFHTDGLWFIPNLFNQKGQYVGGDGFGGPPQTEDVSLEILWQGEYQTFYYSLKVAPFYGDLVGVQQDSIPVSGFINTYGFVKFSLYTDRPAAPGPIVDSLDWGFNGYITTRGGFHNLSGSWSKTNWSEGVLFYQLGTLNGRRRVTIWERVSVYVKALTGFSRDP